jgi:hypothetical protein
MPRLTPKRIVVAKVWVWNGREELRASLDDRGRLETVVHDTRRLDGVAREYAAAWLRAEVLPMVNHEECYRFLWHDAPPAPGAAS